MPTQVDSSVMDAGKAFGVAALLLLPALAAGLLRIMWHHAHQVQPAGWLDRDRFQLW